MNPDQPDFEALRRLLKLKRHETPPPRYFNDFSGQVIIRIKTGDLREQDDFGEKLTLAQHWWQRLVSAFRDGPVLVGASVTTVLVLLVGAAMYTEKLESNPANAQFGNQEARAALQSGPVLGAASPLAAGATNSGSSLDGSAFFNIGLQTQPARYQPPKR